MNQSGYEPLTRKKKHDDVSKIYIRFLIKFLLVFLITGCPVPIFSYFLSLFLFSPISPKFVTKLKMEL